MPLTLNIVTAEHAVLEADDVTKIVVPTTEGQITVLPSHAALMTSLDIGEMDVHSPSGVLPLVVHGGFFQVASDQVTVLADAAERVDEIDEARADAARERAQARIEGRDAEIPGGALDILRAQLALRRALMRLNVKRRRAGTGAPSRTA